MKVAVVTDSTSDLPETLAEENHISTVPATLVIEGQAYLDGPDISRREFYERLPAMTAPPTTAAPASGAFGETYERLLVSGVDQVVSIHAAQQLSGIYNSARVAALDFGERVRVVDSGQVSMGLGFQALAAAESAAAGSPLPEILERIQSVQRRVRVMAMLDTLVYLRRSGRVSWAQASLGSLLRIKPFIELRAGEVRRSGEARTRRKGLARLQRIMIDLGPLERLAMLHTNAEPDARQLAEGLPERITPVELFLNVTTVIGAHVGPAGLGFAAVKAGA
jgi:DegV family protein with EDD domain